MGIHDVGNTWPETNDGRHAGVIYPVPNTQEQELFLIVTQKSLLKSSYSGILSQELILRS